MAFWKGAQKEVAAALPPAAEEPAGQDRVVAALLDFAAGLLREYGRTAIDLEQLASETVSGWCENWAQHLLVGAPKPGEVPKAVPVERRDFIGARRFFAERRRDETAFVTRSLQALQKAVWTFVQTLDGLLVDDDDSDGRLKAEIARLKTVAEGGSAEILRKEVLGTVEEIGRLAQVRNRALRDRVGGLSDQVRTLCNELEVARLEGATDALTRLYNRKALDERLDQAASMARLFGQASSLLLLDVDQFKCINDTHGHVVGDAVLKELADCLIRVFRVKTELVARYGGEEFAILLWDSRLTEAKASADKVQSSLRSSRILYEDKVIPVTVSIGVSQLKPGEAVKAWLERTDRALYAAKSEGRNRVVVDAG
jgi:diguanylate cyclase